MTIETRFNIGDTVWVMKNNRICSGVVEIILTRTPKLLKDGHLIPTFITYTVKFEDDYHPDGIYCEYNEKLLFETKEALIATL